MVFDTVGLAVRVGKAVNVNVAAGVSVGAGVSVAVGSIVNVNVATGTSVAVGSIVFSVKTLIAVLFVQALCCPQIKLRGRHMSTVSRVMTQLLTCVVLICLSLIVSFRR